MIELFEGPSVFPLSPDTTEHCSSIRAKMEVLKEGTYLLKVNIKPKSTNNEQSAENKS
jgi:hypothetical protein